MTDSTPQAPVMPPSTAERLFPTLTPEQITRIAVPGRERQVQRGEVLIEAGERNPRFYSP